MSESTAIQKIDWVLEFFATSPFVKGGISYDFIHRKIKELHPEVDINNDWGDQLNQILEQLEIDKYINHVPQKVSSPKISDGMVLTGFITQKEEYKATFRGNFFYSKKGYQGQENKENASVIRQASEDRRNIFLFAITIAIGIGTIASGVYYCFEMTDFYQNHFCNYIYLSYFATGLLLSSLLWFAGIVLWIFSRKAKIANP